MTGTALYRALVAAGTPEELAKEAASELEVITSDIADIRIILAELKTSVRMLIALNVGAILMSLGLAAKAFI